MKRDHQDVGKMYQNVSHGSETGDLNNVNREPNAMRVSTYSPNIMETPTPKRARKTSLGNYTSTTTTFPGAFAVQCDRCFKWRYINTKEKYEEIREHISVRRFYCETTREWFANKSCDDPSDHLMTAQDGSTVMWALDKADIAKPPPGWERIIILRPDGSIRFADVYYYPPYGKRLRTIKEVEMYLENHPEYAAQGVSVNKFSFEIPRLPWEIC